MFGSKKNKNDFEDDFAFDDDGGDIGQPPSLMKDGGGSSFSPKILIIVVLLLLAGGGAYYFLTQSKPKAPPARPAPARKTVAVAPKPAASAQKPATPAAQTVPAAVSAQPQSAVGPAAAVKPVPSVKPPAAPAVKTAASSPAPAPPAEQAPPPGAPAVENPVQSGGAYVLRGGAYVTKESLLEAERKVRRLGYKPKVTVVRRTVPMTRLRIGYFSPREAQQKLKELAASVPDAFTLRHGDQVALYAGSYTIIDKARSFADELYQKGIRVEEEPTEVLMPVKQLSYGAFATRAAAEKASRKARSIGLPADVEKRP